ncbi:MAG: ABC transporter permease, partial [Planctomycetota bacterium]
MRSFGLLVRRELGTYFASAMAYVIYTAVTAVVGYLFLIRLGEYEVNRMPVRFEEHLTYLIYILVMVSPLITMRLIAEERSRGTLETVMTAPVSDTQFVLAKHVSALLFLHALLVVPILGYAIVMSFFAALDPGAIFTAYVGMLLACAAVFAIGIFISSLCGSQISAGVITSKVAILLMLMRVGAMSVGEETLLGKVLSRLDVLGAAGPFLQGV